MHSESTINVPPSAPSGTEFLDNYGVPTNEGEMYILPVGGHALATSRQEIISLWNDNELGQGAIQLGGAIG